MSIQYSKQALKFLQKQDAPTRKRIINAINNLPLGDVKSFKAETVTGFVSVISELFMTEPVMYCV